MQCNDLFDARRVTILAASTKNDFRIVSARQVSAGVIGEDALRLMGAQRGCTVEASCHVLVGGVTCENQVVRIDAGLNVVVASVCALKITSVTLQICELLGMRQREQDPVHSGPKLFGRPVLEISCALIGARLLNQLHHFESWVTVAVSLGIRKPTVTRQACDVVGDGARAAFDDALPSGFVPLVDGSVVRRMLLTKKVQQICQKGRHTFLRLRTHGARIWKNED